MSGREDLIASLRAIMARRDLDRAEAPSAEELLAYRDGLLDAEERRRMEVRIAAFPDAARALEDLAAFPDVEPVPGVEPPSDDEIDHGWESFRSVLGALEEAAEPEELDADACRATPQVLPEAQARQPQAAIGARLRLAAAVALLAVGTGIGWWLAHGDGDALSVNTVVAELAPLGAVRERSAHPRGAFEDGAWSAAKPVVIPPDAGRVVLVLAVLDAGQFADYSLRLEKADGELRWSGSGLRRQEDGTFRVDLAADELAPGRYRLVLQGVDGSGLEPLATYLLVVAEE